jgi:hypothetical protein
MIDTCILTSTPITHNQLYLGAYLQLWRVWVVSAINIIRGLPHSAFQDQIAPYHSIVLYWLSNEIFVSLAPLFLRVFYRYYCRLDASQQSQTRNTKLTHALFILMRLEPNA